MKLEVSTKALARGRDALQLELQNLKKDVESLSASMDSLNRTWEGEAHEAYLARYLSVRKSLEELCRTLEEFIDLLEYAGSQYLDSDGKVKAAVARIKI